MRTIHCPLPPGFIPEPSARVELKSGELQARELAAELRRLREKLDAILKDAFS